jgi:uncharacterized protein YjbI with pentapeptide repeats
MLIEIKHGFTGEVLFSHDCENNSITVTLEAAISVNAYLGGANLGGANLGGANLGGAYLAGANLGGANLDGANLDGANLDGANLDGANLGGAYLRGAYLRGANLRGAKNIQNSHEILSEIAIRFDINLTAVAAMIRGRIVGCWPDYTKTIRKIFGEATIQRLAEAWMQDEAWGVKEKLIEHGWIKK